MSWRSVAAFFAVPIGALLVMIPFVISDAALAQHRDRDRSGPDGGGDRGRGPGDRDRGPGDRNDWELLGTVRVGRMRVDRDIIDVGRHEGRFEKLGLEAKDGSVHVLELIVVYGNNETERFDLRRELRDGERSPPIDLKGRDRAIKRIEVVGRAGHGSGRHAELSVYGAKARDWNEGWELLGEKKVDRRVDRDIINVGRKEGRFEKIALEVKDNDVEFQSVKVYFRRGPPQDVPVRELIREGGHTRPIDLRGDDRIIERIELVYRTRGRGERATVAVYGLQGAGGPPPGPPPRGRWEELGCGNVGIKADRDTIKVGRREGRFSAIQLRVRGNDVNILDLKVVYDRGPPDDIRVRSLIREGSETRPLDLRGERRVIDRVDLTYKIPLGLNLIKGPAKVCVFGR
jgi:hypothetical protein